MKLRNFLAYVLKNHVILAIMVFLVELNSLVPNAYLERNKQFKNTLKKQNGYRTFF